MELFRNSSMSPEERADDLLARMSTEEKINQLCCYLLTNPSADNPDVHVGSIAAMNAGSTPRQIADCLGRLQEQVMQASRFHIPALFHTEALAGAIHPGCAGFPLSIGSAASFCPDGVKKMAEITRNQLLSLGIRHALSPVLDISRDLRYGRIAETYGSDPTLASAFGCAFVEGMQGDDLTEGVAATAKHFLGCAQAEAGVNQTRAVADERELTEIIAKPFEAAIRSSGLCAVMNSYGEINGEPFCASDYYLNHVLREKMGFAGITTSDYHSIDRLVAPFRLASTRTEAAALAMNGGMDIEFPSKWCYPELNEALKKGLVKMETIDLAVKRLLTLKFSLGLFENPMPEFKEEVFFNERYEEFTKETTARTITLTKNDGILPLTDKSLKIGVIGQPGDSLRHMFGAYTAAGTMEMLMNLAADKDAVGMAGVKLDTVDESAGEVTTEKINRMLHEQYPQAETIRGALAGSFPDLEFCTGFEVENTKEVDPEEWERALSLAERADVLIVCTGGRNGVGKACTSGEGIDAASIELPCGQEELVRQLYSLNPHMVVVHTDARPLVSQFIYENVPAVIEGWIPCVYGGRAIADVITGDYNPCGHLPLDVPGSTGQTPYYYYQRNASSMASIRDCTGDFIVNQDGYFDEYRKAARPFGYGLSYTEFTCSDMQAETDENHNYIITLTVANTGERDGAAVVQLYGAAEYTSVIRSYRELLGFLRVELVAGEDRQVCFTGNLDQFAIENRKGEFLISRGHYRFEISADCETPLLTASCELSEDVPAERADRTFFAAAVVI